MKEELTVIGRCDTVSGGSLLAKTEKARNSSFEMKMETRMVFSSG